ncbi:TPA: TnsD family transposase [Bacillus cereus]|uniref:TnsD family Tn7-like transposition protein n=3 Tax=Bacteria TaxID=2 RepID=UPI0008643E47|nr:MULTISPECIES: TnsD family Tn7-like transposition protein [Bacillales]MCP1177721.1 TnsD family transposase [Bacillus sp. 1663tsa1]MCP1284734.1 TnsD family transposase [Bacillus sp. S0635]MCQ6348532.1 TnsD family transposase [Bacillus cereus]MCU5752090.1 TnsD family transposase [Bacillus cereus]SCM90827.1 Tn7-like transposition protein D [Bacillus cereus]
MLYYFPTPHPDELLYSVLSRYHMMVGNVSPKQTTEELFGKRTVRSVVDLPANLDTLVNRIENPIFNVGYFIYNHTLFPYYGAFFFPKQYQKVKSLMISDKGDRIHTTSGISASNILPKENFMHCSECCKEDMENYGEIYWHRIHQVPGVYICPKHQTFLYETIVPVKAGNQHEYIIATPENTANKKKLLEVNERDKEVLLTYAKYVEELLNSNYQQQNQVQLQQQYVSKLKERGLASFSGRVRRKDLYHSFCKTYSGSLLELLQSNINFDETDWLTMIFQRHRKSFHPIRHLLIMIFLGDALRNYFEKGETYEPFGSGPWCCLNVACKDYMKSVVKNLVITRCYDTKRPVGTFTCHCGFVYSRRGPDTITEDKYKIGRIKDFGDVWKNKLKVLIRDGGTLTGIAKKLNVDPITVKRQATMLELDYSWSGESREVAEKKARFQRNIKAASNEDALHIRKEIWLKLRKEYPHFSKLELRKEKPDVFAFLYRHDREWLNEHSPEKQKIITAKKRVDWSKRDEEMLKEVQKVIKQWDIGDNKPNQITISTIGKRINKLSLIQKKSDKIPKTIVYINSVIEDIETFQIRRVRWIVKNMKINGEELKEWKIYREAGLRNTVSNEVKRMITLLVDQNEYDIT